MKNVMILFAILAMIGIAGAENLLSNGDFLLGENDPDDPTQPNELNPVDWTEVISGGWSNREINPAWPDPAEYHYAMGNNGGYGNIAYQDVAGTAGTYVFSADAMLDAWWMNTLYLKLEFYDAGATTLLGELESAHFSQPGYDTGLPLANYSIEATAPAGTVTVRAILGTWGEGGTARFDNAVLEALDSTATDPDPENGEIGVSLDYTTLSWGVHMVPNPADTNEMILDPNMVSYNLYFDDDPNLVDDLIETATGITNWVDPVNRASHTLAANYDYDGVYFWRVDLVLDDATVVEGNVWSFEAIKSIPVITAQPAPYTLVDIGDVTLSVTVTSISAGTYQWYQDGAAVGSAGVIAAGGTTVATYSVAADAGGANDGTYTCEFTNGATLPGGSAPKVVSDPALVGTKREIAHWDFDDGTTNSSIAGFTTTANEDAAAVEGVGVGGTYGLVCDVNDMLYTDPNETYFDICNYAMTVGCWVKTDSNDVPEWSPLVARNGEEDGWQLRRGNTGAVGDQRAVFTTRGITGNVDGTAALETAFDEQWHYVVGTYDGASKKLYVDGVLQLVWWLDDGAPQSAEGDDVTGVISATGSGVSIAGRYGQDPAQVDDQFITGTYDEVEIWNYARSADDIAQTYANLSGNDACVSPPAYDLTDDCKVNLDDFAKLATEWLDDFSIVDQTP